MGQDQELSKNKRVFESIEAKKVFQKGLKYLALALPLLFLSPVIVTIGFKAINKGNGYLTLILGCALAFFTIILVIQSFRLILKSLFAK